MPSHGDSLERSIASSDHVDILGNHEVIRDILLLAAGRERGVVEQRVVSDIEEIAARVPPPPPLEGR